MTQLRKSGRRIAFPSITVPELEEAKCIKCGETFLSEDRKRVRYCSRCRQNVNSYRHGLASQYVDKRKVLECVEGEKVVT